MSDSAQRNPKCPAGLDCSIHALKAFVDINNVGCAYLHVARLLRLPSVLPPDMLALAKRIHGWSWQAFPIGMGTGAVYVALAGLHRQDGALRGVEAAFYILNIAIFLLNTITLVLQALFFPKQALRLLEDPLKSLFAPLIILSFATIIIGTVNRAVHSEHIHVGFIYAMFWVYVSLAIITCYTMMMIWFNQPHDLTTYTPVDAFLVFPMMLVGVVAYKVLEIMDPADTRSLGVLFAGYFFQGFGFFVTYIYIVIYILRIMTTGFLSGGQANGAFVACGPPGFTALALLNLGKSAQTMLPAHNLISPNAGEIWYAASVMGAIVLFGLAVFFFFLGALPYFFKVNKNLNEILGCWALTFPNVGWINTVKGLGDVLNIPSFYVLHTILAIGITLIWAILIALTVIAFWKGLIFDSKDEEVINDEGELATEVVLLAEEIHITGNSHRKPHESEV